MNNNRICGLVAAATLALTAFAVTPALAGVLVGLNDGANCYPALCNDSGTNVGQSVDFQEAYSASAFSGPLTINSITIFFASQFGGSSDILAGDYSIYLSYSANPVGSLSSNLASNVSGSQSLFFSGHLDGTLSADPSATVNGTPFFYNPSNGDLLLEIIASNQANVPNFSGNGYFEADDTGILVSRAYCGANLGAGNCTGNETGALVTEFNAVNGVPEPMTLSLFGAGLAGAVALRRRKKSVA